MTFVIELILPELNRGLIPSGTWYLESAIQDSIAITQDITKAQEFTNRIDANREVMIRESWQPAYAELRTGYVIKEVTNQ